MITTKPKEDKKKRTLLLTFASNMCFRQNINNRDITPIVPTRQLYKIKKYYDIMQCIIRIGKFALPPIRIPISLMRNKETEKQNRTVNAETQKL